MYLIPSSCVAEEGAEESPRPQCWSAGTAEGLRAHDEVSLGYHHPWVSVSAVSMEKVEAAALHNIMNMYNCYMTILNTKPVPEHQHRWRQCHDEQ